MNDEPSQPTGRCDVSYEASSIRCHNRHRWRRPFAAPEGVAEACKQPAPERYSRSRKRIRRTCVWTLMSGQPEHLALVAEVPQVDVSRAPLQAAFRCPAGRDLSLKDVQAPCTLAPVCSPVAKRLEPILLGGRHTPTSSVLQAGSTRSAPAVWPLGAWRNSTRPFASTCPFPRGQENWAFLRFCVRFRLAAELSP